MPGGALCWGVSNHRRWAGQGCRASDRGAAKGVLSREAPHFGEVIDCERGRAHMLTAGGATSMELSTCQKCTTGKLIPLSDYGPRGVSEVFKTWVCTNPDCGFFHPCLQG